MSSEKEIRTKIRSVQNTQKITKAMEMVAASKMRRAQDRMAAAKPYAKQMRRAIGHIGRANPEYKHPFTIERENVKRVAYIVISSDRGLCGGLNMNLFRKLLGELTDWQQKGVEVDLVTFGGKAVSFFRRMGGNVVAKNSGLGDTPRLNDLIGAIKVVLDSYVEGGVDRVFLASNEFVNTMTQGPTIEQLLPIVPVEDDEDELLSLWDYLYEPDAIDLLDSVLMRYVESQVYQGVVENVACEMAARMVAMKSASDNAGEIIDDLQLAYNKARQAAITQELSEIVAGAAAV